MACKINSIKTGLVGKNWGSSGTHRTSYTNKISNLYPYHSRITLHTLLWDTLYYILLALALYFGKYTVLRIYKPKLGFKIWMNPNKKSCNSGSDCWFTDATDSSAITNNSNLVVWIIGKFTEHHWSSRITITRISSWNMKIWWNMKINTIL